MTFRYLEKTKIKPGLFEGLRGKWLICLSLALLLAIGPSSRLSWAAAGDSGDTGLSLQEAEKALQDAEKERDDLIRKWEEAKREKEEAFRQAQESICKRLTPADCKTIGENFAKIIMYTITGYTLVQMGPVLGLTFLVQMFAVSEALDELAIKPEETAELEKAKLDVSNKKVELQEIEVKINTLEETIKTLDNCTENEWAVQQVTNLAAQPSEPVKPEAGYLKLTLPKDRNVKANESIPFSITIKGGTPPYSLRIYSPVSAFNEINTTLEAGKGVFNTTLTFSTPGTYSVQVNVEDGAISGKQLESGSVVFFVLESDKPKPSSQSGTLKIEPSSKTMKQGETQRFEAYESVADNPDNPILISDKVTWYPSPDFTAKETGIFNVGFSYKGKSVNASVTVVAKEKSNTGSGSGELMSLKIEPSSKTLQQGETQRFEALGTFGDNPDNPVIISDKVTWYPSPDFTAKDTGIFNLGFSFKGKSVNASVTVVKKDSPGQTGATPASLTAELDCGDSFELTPGDFLGKGCGIVVRGWRGNTEDRVEVKVDYNPSSGIEIFPGDTSAPPSLMYTAGVSDYNDRYIFSESFKAGDNAPSGTTTITITISQKGAGRVSLPLRIAVLAKGQSASSGPGIRPPAQVATGSGGNFCVWRYKMFGDPPPCFHFVAAICGKYSLPDYELVGSGMTWGEADARVGQLSRYFDDQYGCTAAQSKPPQQTGSTSPATPPPPPPPPPACIYQYSDWSECALDNLQSRTILTKKPDGCEGTALLLRACIYTPPAPVLTRFGVFCSPDKIDQNGTANCKATGEYSNAIGTYIDLTGRAAWSAGPIFSGKGRPEGSYAVTATLEGASDTATVTVMKGYDPNTDPGFPGKDKPVDPSIKGPMDGFAGGPSQGTRPPKPQDSQTPTSQPTDYTKPPGQPPKPPDQPGTTTTTTTPSTTTPATTPTTPSTPTTPTTPTQPTKPGIDVTVVGTAPPGKCTIVTGQLVAVKGYKENISGMTVVLTGPTSKTTTSSGGGGFSFQDLPAGKYVLSVKQWNYGMTKADFVCESGKAVKVVMKGSCPYLYVWNGNAFEKENDIYSVARLLPQDLLSDESGLLAEKQKAAIFLFSPEHINEKVIKEKTMRDYYRISRPLRPDAEGNYRLKIVEQATEHSFTDQVRLMALDHPKDKKIGITREGQPFMIEEIQPLSTFAKPTSLYHGEFIEIKLPSEAFQKGFVALTWQGFQDGMAEGHSSAAGQPKLSLQRHDPQGIWQTVDWVYPRDEVQ
ncbi:MAG: carboxypeptidase-like regulatory domain-containing protein, partial [Syntrophales bacterium LBB04]|nr:carboxypeptidase-like regulatory domain-containing protein [Syntrophales bacterium LBB04]